MSYRDDLDAAQGRIAALEAELAETRAELNKSTALVKVSEAALARREQSNKTATRWLGAPTRLEEERVVAGDLPESAYLEIVDFLTRHFDIPGRTSTMAGRLEWTSEASGKGTGPFVSVTVTCVDGQTSIRVRDRMGQLAGAIFGGIGGGVGGGGIGLPIAAFLINPIVGAAAIPVWFGGVYWLSRRIYKWRVRKHRELIDEAIDALVEIVERAIDRARAEDDDEG